MLGELKYDDGVVLVWQGVLIKDSELPDAENLLKSFGAEKVNILGKILTLPDTEDGKEVSGTGGRTDWFFEVSGTTDAFWIKRLQNGFRLLSDVLWSANSYQDNPIYPEWIFDYLRDNDNWDKK
jgi:hypothetical protein